MIFQSNLFITNKKLKINLKDSFGNDYFLLIYVQNI